jgi:hypothetical protein
MRVLFCVAAFAAFSTLGSYSALGESIRQPSGMYVMQGLHQSNVSNSVLSSPVLSGIHLRDSWSLVEPAPLGESFDWLDGQILRAKILGKEVTLGIYAGVQSPTWLNVPLCNGVPIPWDPLVQSAHSEMVAALGDHYRNESAIAAVHISSPATNRSLEMFLAEGLTTLPDYSDQKIIDSWKSSIDAYSDAFPNTSLVLDIAMVPDVNGAVTDAVTSYAQSVLGARANFIHCSLKATTSPAAPHQQTILGLHQAGSQVGFEMVSPSNDTTRFGGPFTDALAIGQVAGASWYQIYQSDIPNIPANFFSVPGDYNHDGKVDAGDYLVWRSTFGSTNMTADGDRNGRVDDGDLALWRANFGTANGQVGVLGLAVPEQSSCAFLSVFTVVVIVSNAISRVQSISRSTRTTTTIRPRTST